MICKNQISNRGFSLMEIMVALSLIALTFLLIPSSADKRDRMAIDDAANELDRAIRYAQDEAILHNVVTRISIDLDKEPQEYSVEIAQSGNIPLPEEVDYSRLSMAEREEELKKEKSFNSLFSRTDDFSKGGKKFSEILRIYGVKTDYLSDMIFYENAYIYFFPTGEKDSALIIFSTESEMASLDIPSFALETKLKYYSYSDSNNSNIDDIQEQFAQEILNEWEQSL